MTRRIRVKITQKHISSGIPGDASNCAGALALADAGIDDPLVFPKSHKQNVIVFGKTIRQEINRIPQRFLEFSSRFDEGKKVEPLDVDFLVPQLAGYRALFAPPYGGTWEDWDRRHPKVKQPRRRIRSKKIEPKARGRIREWLLKECQEADARGDDQLQQWYDDGWWFIALMAVPQIHTADFWSAIA
jgi:hypothetical protein